MKHYLELVLIIIVIACSKENLDIQKPVWGSQCITLADTMYAKRFMISGVADSTRCLFYINNKLKQEGKSGFLKCALVKGDSLLIYKSYAFLGKHTWVDLDTTKFIFFPIEKIPVYINGRIIK